MVKVAQIARNILCKDSVVQHNHTVFCWTDLNFTFCWNDIICCWYYQSGAYVMSMQHVCRGGLGMQAGFVGGKSKYVLYMILHWCQVPHTVVYKNKLKRISYISTRSTLIPHGSVASSSTVCAWESNLTFLTFWKQGRFPWMIPRVEIELAKKEFNSSNSLTNWLNE